MAPHVSVSNWKNEGLAQQRRGINKRAKIPSGWGACTGEPTKTQLRVSPRASLSSLSWLGPAAQRRATGAGHLTRSAAPCEQSRVAAAAWWGSPSATDGRARRHRFAFEFFKVWMKTRDAKVELAGQVQLACRRYR